MSGGFPAEARIATDKEERACLGPVLIDAPKQQQSIMGFVVLAVNALLQRRRRCIIPAGQL